MRINKNVSLAKYSTMRLGGEAKFLATINNPLDIPNALNWAGEKNLPVIMVGDGSNIIWKDKGFDGLVLVNNIKEFTITKNSVNEYFVKIGAGENWDSVVERTVKEGLHGIEAMSLIPGSAGATPIQNVGAYGQDISGVLESVEAYDSQTDSFITIPADACGLGYRTSRFKAEDKGRFFITSITICLSKDKKLKPPFYESLQKYVDQMGITDFSPQTIREIVIAIRSSKLPDPAKVANNGSFFANPIISKTKFKALEKKYPHIKGWESDGKIKVPAGWLLEEAGFKGFHDKRTGMATWDKQALVLVNEQAQKTADLITFRDRIISEIKSKFGITLEQEPEILP